MGKIVISTNVTLDGVVQDPDGEEGFRHGGWFGQFGGTDLGEWAKVSCDEALRSEACCWVGAATNGSQLGGHRGVASGRTA